MKLACPRTMMADEPMSQNTSANGDANHRSGSPMTKRPVYSPRCVMTCSPTWNGSGARDEHHGVDESRKGGEQSA